jgi:hypothetical protein
MSTVFSQLILMCMLSHTRRNVVDALLNNIALNPPRRILPRLLLAVKRCSVVRIQLEARKIQRDGGKITAPHGAWLRRHGRAGVCASHSYSGMVLPPSPPPLLTFTPADVTLRQHFEP